MLRRRFLLACAVPLAAAAAAPEVMDVFTTLATALSEGNAVAFMRPFDPAMPGVEKLRTDVTALLLRADVLASLEFRSDEGDDARRTVTIDWLLQIRDKEPTGRLVHRRETVKCRLERRGKKWVITSLEPAGFFCAVTRYCRYCRASSRKSLGVTS